MSKNMVFDDNHARGGRSRQWLQLRGFGLKWWAIIKVYNLKRNIFPPIRPCMTMTMEDVLDLDKGFNCEFKVLNGVL